MVMGPPSFDERYRAVESRDSRFDGQFVMAVRTTGIYCRPSCPARTPKKSNVAFFTTSAAAHEAGFRACKRCLPEAAPGSPEWDLRGDVVGRAMRLIADGLVDREGVASLASRLGYSSRHLSRILSDELGAGPLALARAQRAHTARMLLINTDLPVAKIAFSAGFGSIRQCNDTIQEIFGLTPSELRSRRRSIESIPGEIALSLPVREPFDSAGVFRWLMARTITGMEQASETSYSRNVELHGGPAWFEVTADSETNSGRAATRLKLRVRVSEPGDLGALVTRVRRLFDLDADPMAIDTALAGHPEVVAQVRHVPGIRVPGAVDPHEMLIRTMVSQQVSVASARTTLTRVVEALGVTVAVTDGRPARMFPTMATIAEGGAQVLRGPGARVRAIVDAAGALADGSLQLDAGDDRRALRERLLALRGVGPWTADYVRMRVLNDPDVVLTGDVIVRAGASALGLPDDERGLAEWAIRAAPWRSYLNAHLWRAASETNTNRTNNGEMS
ncbi:MAG: Ada metal-binding domain-containing protein [Microthrixaceae bacterium]